MDQEQPSGERLEGFSSSIRHRSVAAAPQLPTPYPLMLQREKLLTSGFQSPLALTERRGTGVVREAWTDIGDVGAGRRSDLTRNERNRQIPTSLGWTPPVGGRLLHRWLLPAVRQRHWGMDSASKMVSSWSRFSGSEPQHASTRSVVSYDANNPASLRIWKTAVHKDPSTNEARACLLLSQSLFRPSSNG